MRVLLVEDNQRLATIVAEALRAAGFAVDAVATAGDAEAAAGVLQYDVIILDLGLPDDDGLEVLKRLRGAGHGVPVLILTARDGLEDRVSGLNLGADDYVLKPFDMAELIARLHALLRRPGGALGAELMSGNLRLDTLAREARIGEAVLPLSRRELSVLEHFMRRAGRVVPKTLLEESLYGYDDAGSANSVEVAVHRLRKKLVEAGAEVSIHTLRGIGYLLTQEPPDGPV